MTKKETSKTEEAINGVIGFAVLGLIGYFGFQYIFGATEADRVIELDQPSRLSALLEDNQSLSLTQFKELDRMDRDNLVKSSLLRFAAPPESLDKFTACIGDFSVSKSPELNWFEVMEWCDKERQNNPERFADHFDELNAKDLATMAKIICEADVKQRLRSPASADFPFLDYRHLNKGRQRYLIQSYVDSQNAFGADIRTNWTCDIQYNGSGEDADRRNWTVHTLEMF